MSVEKAEQEREAPNEQIRLTDLQLPDSDLPIRTSVEFLVPTLEQRAAREEALRADRDQFDERTPLERLFDLITRARLAYYRPDVLPAERRDIICLCCGILYRPDDALNGENIYLCLSCIRTRQGT